MAKHRIRRWFQFGILDILIVTTVVAIAAVLSQPARAQSNKAPPWVVGLWVGDSTSLCLFPDGFFVVAPERGFGWTLTRHSTPDAFVLICGEQRFVVRSEWGSGAMDLLNEDGSIQSSLRQILHLEGPMRGGFPDGTWRAHSLLSPQDGVLHLLEYRQGELVDWHREGTRDLMQLNLVRKVRGLTTLTAHDFSDSRKTGTSR
jgi:hypothetical protein